MIAAFLRLGGRGAQNPAYRPSDPHPHFADPREPVAEPVERNWAPMTPGLIPAHMLNKSSLDVPFVVNKRGFPLWQIAYEIRLELG